jgi:hypothetical protein
MHPAAKTSLAFLVDLLASYLTTKPCQVSPWPLGDLANHDLHELDRASAASSIDKRVGH